jgi:hypothetical protein
MMNQKERNDLRAKHILETYEDRVTKQEVETCGWCCLDEWPCDALRVLDSLDQIAFWVDHHNGMDVHGAIGRIQEMLL